MKKEKNGRETKSVKLVSLFAHLVPDSVLYSFIINLKATINHRIRKTIMNGSQFTKVFLLFFKF